MADPLTIHQNLIQDHGVVPLRSGQFYAYGLDAAEAVETLAERSAGRALRSNAFHAL